MSRSVENASRQSSKSPTDWIRSKAASIAGGDAGLSLALALLPLALGVGLCHAGLRRQKTVGGWNWSGMRPFEASPLELLARRRTAASWVAVAELLRGA
ncbi:hypothetical protein [Pseudomonas aeruginosa]|uniref:hypothetical protein n=1 Tax=Pseudomonas aeruginosa TaxID=287 RepID=UPI001365F14B|nr:hypothetical protein [Pseudomonas aeruginosa]